MQEFDFSLFYNPQLVSLFETGFSVFDLEIEKGIVLPGDKGNQKHPMFKYCEGFDDFYNMGISTAAVYSSKEDRFAVYTDETAEGFWQTLEAPIVVGFNNRQFDNNLLFKTWGDAPSEKQTYDILEEIWNGLGLKGQPFTRETHAGYGLDAMCKANLGPQLGKTIEGKYAPLLWQVGRQGEVFDYNLADVARTRALLFLIQIQGYLKDPKDGKHIPIRKPLDK